MRLFPAVDHQYLLMRCRGISIAETLLGKGNFEPERHDAGFLAFGIIRLH
jgi:hypothetical protein